MTEISAWDRRAAKGTPALAARVLELVASGQASSRAELAGLLGAAASTISLTVAHLVERGLIAEEGTQSSTGGRPRKVLRLGSNDEFAVAADLGGRHARIGVVLPGGGLTDVSTVPFEIADGPEAALPRLAETLEALAEQRGRGRLRGVGLSLPGPVDIASGSVVRPSRMPGWNRFPVTAWLEERFGVPAAVDNDANCMAVGEHTVRPAEHRQTIMVKIGSAIGAGVIADGRLYRGATGAAGDITHIRIDAGADIPCSCGNTGCLETVASGAALVRILRERGADVSSPEDVARLAIDADPLATARSARPATTSAKCSPPTSTSSIRTPSTSAASSPPWNRSSPPCAASSTRAATRSSPNTSPSSGPASAPTPDWSAPGSSPCSAPWPVP